MTHITQMKSCSQIYHQIILLVFFFSLFLKGGLARFYSATIIAPIEIIKTIQTGELIMDKDSFRLFVYPKSIEGKIRIF
jgi:hypothetical protein